MTSFSESVRADFKRYRDVGMSSAAIILYTQGFWATFVYRVNRRILGGSRSKFVKPFAALLWRTSHKAIEILTGISLPPQCEIGPGLYIPHFGPIVLNGGVVIGKNCTLHQGVTIGNNGRPGDKRCPILGDDVILGVNALLIGGITLGDSSIIGAGAVVTKSVPSQSTAVGNPARIIRGPGLKVDDGAMAAATREA